MTGPTETPLFTLDGGLFDDVSTLATTPVDELDLPRETTTKEHQQ